MNIDEMTYGELKQIAALFAGTLSHVVSRQTTAERVTLR
jgi:hypothetical protein